MGGRHAHPLRRRLHSKKLGFDELVDGRACVCWSMDDAGSRLPDGVHVCVLFCDAFCFCVFMYATLILAG